MGVKEYEKNMIFLDMELSKALGTANREFLPINDIADGIMRKDERNGIRTESETTREQDD